MTQDPPELRFRPVMPGKKIHPTQHGVEPVAATMFIVRWMIDGEPIALGYPQQHDALQQVGRLFDQYGTDLDVEVHLNRLSPPPSLFYGPRWLRKWNANGRPPVRD